MSKSMSANSVPAGSTPTVELPTVPEKSISTWYLSPASLYGVLITGTVLPGLGVKPAPKKSAESGGPTVLGVNPIAGVDKLPFTKLVAVTVAKPDRADPPGQVPSATAGPP